MHRITVLHYPQYLLLQPDLYPRSLYNDLSSTKTRLSGLVSRSYRPRKSPPVSCRDLKRDFCYGVFLLYWKGPSVLVHRWVDVMTRPEFYHWTWLVKIFMTRDGSSFGREPSSLCRISVDSWGPSRTLLRVSIHAYLRTYVRSLYICPRATDDVSCLIYLHYFGIHFWDKQMSRKAFSSVNRDEKVRPLIVYFHKRLKGWNSLTFRIIFFYK